MLEEKESAVALLKEAMKELGMTKKGHVTFHPSGMDFVAFSERGATEVLNYAPRWKITLRYPIDEEERSKQIDFEINTFDFQNGA